MCQRDDLYLLATNPVNDLIRKAGQNVTPRIAGRVRPGAGEVNDLRAAMLHGKREIYG
jgi:hypothetical protein